MKAVKLILVACITLASSFTHAQYTGLAGKKNVILIHGLHLEHLFDPSGEGVNIIGHPNYEAKQDAVSYWDQFNPAFIDHNAGVNSAGETIDNILHWPSTYRIEDPDETQRDIAILMYEQLNELIGSGYCYDENNPSFGCVFITHSAGDLIGRYILDNKSTMVDQAHQSKFKIHASIDMNGSGGGTALATLYVKAINLVNLTLDEIEALAEWFGLELNFEELTAGVQVDFQPTVARNIGFDNAAPNIPRLRIATSGDETFGTTKWLMEGDSDSIIPLHSTCGAAEANAYYSCVKNLDMDGHVTHVHHAPTKDQLYDYHYPLIMSDTISHNEVRYNTTGNYMTVVAEYNNMAIGDIYVDVESHEFLAWWDWYNHYRLITNAEFRTVGEVIARSFK